MRKVNSFKFAKNVRKYKLVSKEPFINAEGNEQRDYHSTKRPGVVVAKIEKLPDGTSSYFVEDLYQNMFIVSQIKSAPRRKA